MQKHKCYETIWDIVPPLLLIRRLMMQVYELQGLDLKKTFEAELPAAFK